MVNIFKSLTDFFKSLMYNKYSGTNLNAFELIMLLSITSLFVYAFCWCLYFLVNMSYLFYKIMPNDAKIWFAFGGFIVIVIMCIKTLKPSNRSRKDLRYDMLDKVSAEIIVQQYGAALAQEKTPARKISLLPCPKGRIKLALRVVIENGIKEKVLSEDMLQNLIATYGFIDTFIEDEKAELINETLNLINSKKIDLTDPSYKYHLKIYKDFISEYTQNDKLEEIKKFVNALQV